MKQIQDSTAETILKQKQNDTHNKKTQLSMLKKNGFLTVMQTFIKKIKKKKKNLKKKGGGGGGGLGGGKKTTTQQTRQDNTWNKSSSIVVFP